MMFRHSRKLKHNLLPVEFFVNRFMLSTLRFWERGPEARHKVVVQASSPAPQAPAIDAQASGPRSQGNPFCASKSNSICYGQLSLRCHVSPFQTATLI